jgi:DNA-binding HxlR family transcriptional regulator
MYNSMDPSPVKTYGQACGLAKALDMVGDRWTMLIVRELLVRGACRYTDLKLGLPGVATNLLALRLRELEAAGLVRRAWSGPPVATDLFSLTERGQALEPAILTLGQWGAAALADCGPSDVFQAHWMVLPLRLFLTGVPDIDGVSIAVRSGGEDIAIVGRAGGCEVRLGALDDPTTVVSGPGQAILGLFAGRLDLSGAERLGVAIAGDRAALARLLANRGQGRRTAA